MPNALGALLVALAVLGAPTHHGDTHPLEDEPGWNCATDGNRICGPDYEPDTGAYIGGYN